MTLSANLLPKADGEFWGDMDSRKMAHRQSSNSTLLVSLLTLTAATAVTVVAVTAWTGEISERLTGQSVIADELPENIVIGGVDGANTYGATSTAPSPVYRSADERLPSQTADQVMAQIPDEGLSEALSDTTNTSIATPEDNWLDELANGVGSDASAVASTAAATPDVIRQQEGILEEMRRAHAPVEGRF
jgi:hypothetical protein